MAISIIKKVYQELLKWEEKRKWNKTQTIFSDNDFSFQKYRSMRPTPKLFWRWIETKKLNKNKRYIDAGNEQWDYKQSEIIQCGQSWAGKARLYILKQWNIRIGPLLFAVDLIILSYFCAPLMKRTKSKRERILSQPRGDAISFSYVCHPGAAPPSKRQKTNVVSHLFPHIITKNI